MDSDRLPARPGGSDPERWAKTIEAIAEASAALGDHALTAAERDGYEQGLAAQLPGLGCLIAAVWKPIFGDRSRQVGLRDEFGDPVAGSQATYHMLPAKVVHSHLRRSRTDVLVRSVPGRSSMQLVSEAPGSAGARKVRELIRPGYAFTPEGGARLQSIPGHDTLAVAAELLDLVSEMGRVAERHRGGPSTAQISAARDAVRALTG